MHIAESLLLVEIKNTVSIHINEIISLGLLDVHEARTSVELVDNLKLFVGLNVIWSWELSRGDRFGHLCSILPSDELGHNGLFGPINLEKQTSKIGRAHV